MLFMLFVTGVLCFGPSKSQFYPQDDENAYEDHGHYVESHDPKAVDIRVCTRLELLSLFQRPHDHELCEDHPSTQHVDPLHPDSEQFYDFCQDPKHLIHFSNSSASMYQHFSMFRREHKESLLQVKNYLMNATSPEELVRMAKSIRHCLHEYLFHAGLLSVLAGRDYDFDAPDVIEYDPSNFIESQYLETIIEKDMEYYGTEGKILNRKKKQVRYTVSFETLPNGNFHLSKTADLTGSDPHPENRVAYFREDFGLNSHHYNWHLVQLPGTPRIYDYFIYMHRQMLARYNAERFSVGLPRVIPYGDLRQPIEEGHNPNLGFDNNQFGERPPNSIPVNFPNVSSSIAEHDQNRTNLERVISSRLVDDAAFSVMLEDYHNNGHVLISSVAINGPTNVMDDASTAARDTVFYRWHTHIDELYERYASMRRQVTGDTLTSEELVMPTLKIWNAHITSFRETKNHNEIVTGCSYHTNELSNGLDFSGDEQAFINMTHLDHIPFTHHIQVDNLGQEERRGVVRIFLALKYDEKGNIFNLEDQRKFWIEMDKFMYTFSPGRNSIRRHSQNSSVSVDCRDTFDDIAERIKSNLTLSEKGHCGCGWPQHLLVPKGTPAGQHFVMFVLITDDHHIQATDWRLGRSTYCGTPKFDQPDQRPHGYPFHHPAPGNHTDVASFANNVSNAFAVDILIKFSGFQTDESESSIPSCMQPRK